MFSLFFFNEKNLLCPSTLTNLCPHYIYVSIYLFVFVSVSFLHYKATLKFYRTHTHSSLSLLSLSLSLSLNRYSLCGSLCRLLFFVKEKLPFPSTVKLLCLIISSFHSISLALYLFLTCTPKQHGSSVE